MMRVDELADGSFQLRNVAMDAATQLFVRQLGEPAFDEVQPRPVRRGEVDVNARSLRKPVANQRRLVGPVVVHDQMDVQRLGHGRVDRVEELPKFDGAVASMKLRHDLRGLDIQGGEERRGAMPFVVVRPAFHLPRPHRQQWLRAIERLNLRLLVDTEHDGVRGRMHVESDDVAHLFDEQRVVRQFERLAAMRLQTEGAPDLLDRCATQSAAFAIPRLLQCVATRGVSSSVRTITCSTWSSVICRGVPGRGSSYNPSSRSRTNRPRHLQTVVCDMRSRLATVLLSCPSAHVSTIRARRARRGAVRERWANESSRTRSSSVRISATLGRPSRMLASL